MTAKAKVAKLGNPYLDEFNRVDGGADSLGLMLCGRFDELAEARRKRYELVCRYGWAVPNHEAVKALVKLSPIVEIGAGTGYWARLITEAGGDVVAYDNKSWAKMEHSQWYEVHKGTPIMVRRHPDRTLFLCWPPYDTTMAEIALRHYKGSNVVYVGESAHGCNGNEEFHDMLYEHWKLKSTIKIPRWSSVYDSMFVYARKGNARRKAK